ncbi:CsbD family protein [Pleurocapsales cyanobacterium LEGE 06147]|nr:CsbD family protein [Pleurocapsales cyanobacterium LEGE 06147]
MFPENYGLKSFLKFYGYKLLTIACALFIFSLAWIKPLNLVSTARAETTNNLPFVVGVTGIADKVEGKVEENVGKAQRNLGKVTGQTEGVLKQAEGKVQQKAGEVTGQAEGTLKQARGQGKQNIGEAKSRLDSAGSDLEDASDSLVDSIKDFFGQ